MIITDYEVEIEKYIWSIEYSKEHPEYSIEDILDLD